MKIDADQLPKEARLLAEQKRRPASTPYGDFIVNAVRDGRTILNTQCQFEVSYNQLRGWIHGQPEFRDSAQANDTVRSRVMFSE
jgi:hypothetical protein